MPAIYGTNTAFDTFRAMLATQLAALEAQMVTDAVTPRFAAIYNTHWDTPAVVFPSISVGIPQVIDRPLSSAGQIEYLYSVELRILTGESNAPNDEVVFLELANSVFNWFRSHRAALKTAGFYIKDEVGIKVEPNIVYEDTRTIGGRVMITFFGIESYVQL